MSKKHRLELEMLLKTLLQMRIGAGLTQEELASRLSLPQSTVSKVESGTRKIDLLELRKWCLAAGFTLLEFIGKFEENLYEEE